MMEVDMIALILMSVLACADKETDSLITNDTEVFCDTLEEVGLVNSYDDVDSQSSGRIEIQLIVDLPNTRDLAYIGNQSYTLQNPSIGSGEQYATSDGLGLIEKTLGAGEWELYVENDFDCTAELTIQVEAGVRTQQCLLLECPE